MIAMLQSGQYATFVLLIFALVLSLTFHEYGHAIVAKWHGDDTAEKLGRLTLNPLVHIDPLGLAMVVLVGFGFAKPVPFDPRNFHSRSADLWVAAAGPFMNLVLAVGSWTIFQILFINGFNSEATQQFFVTLASINLLLMLFNLIPLGPLDGHYILPYFLPRELAHKYRDLNARFGTLAFIALIVLSLAGVPIFSYLMNTAYQILNLMTFV